MFILENNRGYYTEYALFISPYLADAKRFMTEGEAERVRDRHARYNFKISVLTNQKMKKRNELSIEE